MKVKPHYTPRFSKLWACWIILRGGTVVQNISFFTSDINFGVPNSRYGRSQYNNVWPDGLELYGFYPMEDQTVRNHQTVSLEFEVGYTVTG